MNRAGGLIRGIGGSESTRSDGRRIHGRRFQVTQRSRHSLVKLRDVEKIPSDGAAYCVATRACAKSYSCCFCELVEIN